MHAIKVTGATLCIMMIALLVWGLFGPAILVAGLGDGLTPNYDAKVPFQGFELPLPQSEGERIYLGVSGLEKFEVGQIGSSILIIEVFSMYCPHCQRAAPKVNELYQTIEGRPDLKGKIKMIGIGVGNSVQEVKIFKEKYKVEFPLFPDQKVTIGDQLGVKGTPTFIGVKLTKTGAPERFYFKSGGFADPSGFLSEIVKLSGID